MKWTTSFFTLYIYIIILIHSWVQFSILIIVQAINNSHIPENLHRFSFESVEESIEQNYLLYHVEQQTIPMKSYSTSKDLIEMKWNDTGALGEQLVIPLGVSWKAGRLFHHLYQLPLHFHQCTNISQLLCYVHKFLLPTYSIMINCWNPISFYWVLTNYLRCWIAIELENFLEVRRLNYVKFGPKHL